MSSAFSFFENAILTGLNNAKKNWCLIIESKIQLTLVFLATLFYLLMVHKVEWWDEMNNGEEIM
jgi:hypothetical protein